MEGKEIAETIIQQLGGFNRLKLMIGASNLSYSNKEKSVSFKFKMFPKANYLTVKLDQYDTYTMEFIRATVKGIKVFESYEHVYAEDLVPIFKRVTGLELTIPRIVGINA